MEGIDDNLFYFSRAQQSSVMSISGEHPVKVSVLHAKQSDKFKYLVGDSI